MKSWAARLNSFSEEIAQKTKATRNYVTENIYTFSSDSIPEELEAEIERINLPLLSLTTKAEISPAQMYLLQPLLRALIDNFFGVKVSTFRILRINSILKFIPVLSTTENLYFPWDRISYFSYYVSIDSLLGYYYITDKERVEEAYHLFGVYFTDDSSLAMNKSLLVENEKVERLYHLTLPREDLIKEITESFSLGFPDIQIKDVRKGTFWTQLNKYWVIDSWKNILENSLPRAVVYIHPLYLDVYSEPTRRKALLSMLAFLSRAKDFSTTSNSISFQVSSLGNIRKIMERFAVYYPYMNSWLVIAVNDEEQMVILQRALEKKYPQSLTYGENNIVVSNAEFLTTPSFTEEELNQAAKEVQEGILPKQYYRKEKEVKIPQLLDREGDSVLEINNKVYNLEMPYSELSPLWSQGILTPWSIVRYKQGLWTKYWHK